MIDDLTRHKEISFHLFSNLTELISKNKLSELTGYNWRTIKHHLELMSIGYKERRNVTQK